ncbi:MAG: hypothetical protein HOM11_05680 [Methylococcales bacterium]|nr:hypothetical protein [Methylococcales bacterium]MBT7444217.1 hypothetical protein [Methylococcales bacterium]
MNASRDKTNRRKLSQLCRQAERALTCVFEGELGNPILNQITLLEVTPAEHGRAIVVTVGPITDSEATTRSQVETALQHADGRLRSILAQTMSRKRVPLLNYIVHGFKEGQG